MSELTWTMDVQDMPHTSGLEYPVFHWVWGQKNGAKGIDLRAWITMGGLTYQERREEGEKEDIPLETLETVRAYLEKMGLPEPSFLEVIFGDVSQFHNERLPHFKSREEAKQACRKLKEKWQGLLN